jgi:hypothetical protein
VFAITYLTFDLRDQTGTVLGATLTLSCTSASRDGGTIYPVADSRWVEGTRTGKTSTSAGGPGLKWNDVDTNGDGLIDALDTSPFVPDFATPLATVGPVVVGQTATVDLTAAFQRGPGFYSFAIRNGSPNGATYSSRNHPDPTQRPRLHLVVQ